MFIQIINSIEFFFFKLNNQFEELLTYSYYVKDYFELISELQTFNEKIHQNFLEKSYEIRVNIESNEQIVYEKFDEYYQDIAFFFPYFTVLNFFISNIKNSRNIDIHQGNFILVKEHLTKKAKFILLQYPKVFNRLNYGYLDIYKILNEFRIEYEEIKDFHFFFIPYFNHADIFSNSLLGHEIGHFIEGKYNIWTDIERTLITKKVIHHGLIEPILKKKLNLETEGKEIDLIYEWLLTNKFENWREKLRNWVKEIISDLIGLKIFGLPLFFSFIEIIFLIDPRSLGDNEHPPNWIRLKYLIDSIRNNIESYINNIFIRNNDSDYPQSKEYIGQNIKKRLDFLEGNFSIKIKMDSDYDEEIIKIIDSKELSNLIDESIANLIENKYITEFLYSSEENITEINQLLTLLKNYITPNEIVNIEERNSRPANTISILNAGWFFYLFNLKDHFDLFNVDKNDYLGKAIIQQKLDNLILKAIELSKIHKKSIKKMNDLYGFED